jgi:predicted lysophospholipase L1 biosynthesis ABC-type transport system permease subunit
MAEQFWPHQDPIGKRFSMVGDAGPFLEIVGEVSDGKYQTVAEDSQAFFYVPLAQHFVSKRTLQIRSLVPPESLAGAVKGQVRRLAPTLPILNIETMQDSVAGAFGFFAFRLAASLSAALGIIGLILAVVGVYGVVSFAASRRTHEIGIRMALGADARDILHLVWKQGVRLVMLGVVVGIVAAWALARTAMHLLAGVSVTDPATYLSVAALLIVVGIAACWIPARRAMQADPMIALRHE